MLSAGALTFQEFVTHEPIPLASIHAAVLEYLRGRDDAVLFGAQAVNAYVAEPRMTQDVDILSTRAEALARDLRSRLNQRFHIAARVRKIKEGLGYRIYQVQKPQNRHLVDVRSVAALPEAQRMEEVLVAAPADLIAMKVIAFEHRRGQPKSGTDWRDLAMLLLAFPGLKRDAGLVRDRLVAFGASRATLAAWKEIAAQRIRREEEDSGY